MTTETKQTYVHTTNGPAHKLRAGAVTATVWNNVSEHEGKNHSFNSITLERVYKDKAGNWQTTSTFRVNDLPKLALMAQKAYEHVVLTNSEKKQDTVNNI